MTHNRKTLHPLQVIAGFHLVDKTTHMALSLDQLNRWLAQKAGVDYVRIDPLKTDVPSVTSIMSFFEYARSQHILPVAVTQDTVEIGTDQAILSRLAAQYCAYRVAQKNQNRINQS